MCSVNLSGNYCAISGLIIVSEVVIESQKNLYNMPNRMKKNKKSSTSSSRMRAVKSGINLTDLSEIATPSHSGAQSTSFMTSRAARVLLAGQQIEIADKVKKQEILILVPVPVLSDSAVIDRPSTARTGALYSAGWHGVLECFGWEL